MYGAKKQPHNHSEEGKNRGDDVVEDGLPDRHPGLEQHREVPDLVGQLVTQDGQRGREPAHVTVGESSPNSEPICKVVDAVPEDDHPGNTGDVLRGGVGVVVGVAVAVVVHLVLGDDDSVPAPELPRPVLREGAGGGAGHHEVLLRVQVAGAVAAVVVQPLSGTMSCKSCRLS